MTDLIISGIDSILQTELANITELLDLYSLQYEIRQYSYIEILINAIQLILGFSMAQLKEHSRKTEQVYARWIFFHHLHSLCPRYTYAEIGAFLNCNRSTVGSAIKEFDAQNNAFNPVLRRCVERVNLFLKAYYINL
ncbi:MAG: hypothetical protein FWH39_01650 [Bacteroidales bacterium]|nr:hypothetical protein [Bacteroidales bacterium]